MTGITAPLTYNGFISAIATLAVVPTMLDAGGVNHFSEAYLDGVTPQMLNYAELRIQRDMNHLASQKGIIYPLAQGISELDIPFGDFVIVQNITLASNNPDPDAPKVYSVLTPTSKEFIQNTYPDPTYQGVPRYFAPLGADTNPLGATEHIYAIFPIADQLYNAFVVGTTRMPSLYLQKDSAPNTGTTFISSQMPDLLLMATMVFISGYQRNFNAAGSDPQSPINYETQYQALLKGAMTEEFRRRFLMVPGTGEAPSPANMPKAG